jgi:2-methylisocitrate lyase-like PEP mutase family enzyme
VTAAGEFAARHVPGRPLFLPNAWDVASATALVRAGWSVIATTSYGVAASHGLADGLGQSRAETLALARQLQRLPCMLTVDIEGGFSDDADDVADLAEHLRASGVVGVNIEDSRDNTRLVDADHVAAVIRAVKSRVPDLFVNARMDTYWVPDGPEWTQTPARLATYLAAGADGIFIPRLPHERIREVAAGCRLNILYEMGGPSLSELADLGAARVSTGSVLFRGALDAAVKQAQSIADGSTPTGPRGAVLAPRCGPWLSEGPRFASGGLVSEASPTDVKPVAIS